MDFIIRKDLTPAQNLKKVFQDIRNRLAGSLKGITRDEKLIEQLIFLLFCKLKDEQERSLNEPVLFQLHHPSTTQLSARILRLFQSLKDQYPYIFEKQDSIIIDEENLIFITDKLQKISITEASRDVIGDAFEVILGSSLRGNKGQFFTPRNVASTMIQILDPQPNEKILDPACGAGGFLITSLKQINQVNGDKLTPITSNTLFGIDKDFFLVKIAKLYLSILGVHENTIYCENSLEPPSKWGGMTKNKIQLNEFDIVCTNPPFGSKISITSKEVLSNYAFGHKWKISKKSDGDTWTKGKELLEKQAPQILFIERSLQFLKQGGRLAIILPDGLFGNPTYKYIWDFLLRRVKLIAIISCSHLTFLPFTHTKTSLLFLENENPPINYSFFMAIAKNVGHDKNGKPLYKIDKVGNHILDENEKKLINDDFPEIIKRFHLFQKGEDLKHSHLGFILDFSNIESNILIPEYYNPEIKEQLNHLENSGKYILRRLGDLEKSGIISITRGHEVGSKFYGTGNIPFVRTSDLINWEINIDPKKQVAYEVYELYRERQDIQEGDVLLVCDGTFLIGKTAIVTKEDTEIIIQSHLKKIRVTEKTLIDEYFLLWALNSPIVQDQIKSKTFIQATISTLGNRVKDLVIPIPSSLDHRKRISRKIKAIIIEKMDLKRRMRESLHSF